MATNQELCAKGKQVFAPFDNRFLCVQGSDALTSNPTFYTGSRMASMQNCDAQLRNGSGACFYGGACGGQCRPALHDAGGGLTLALLRRRRDVLRQGCGPALPVRAR